MFRSVGISLAFASVALTSGAFAHEPGRKMPVTVDNFPRAETDHYLAANAKAVGGLGKFQHSREPVSIDKQTVIRMNRDTLYSFAVFDLAGGSVTLSLPDTGKRYMSMMVVDQDHYLPIVAYGTKPVTLTQKSVGTRYAFVAIRTLVDPNDPKDLGEVHKLQDAIKKTVESEEFKEAGKQIGFTPAYQGSAEFTKMIATDDVATDKVMKEVGLKK